MKKGRPEILLLPSRAYDMQMRFVGCFRESFLTNLESAQRGFTFAR